MTTPPPNGSGPLIRLTPQIQFQLGAQWQGSAQVAPPPAAVLGDDSSAFDPTAGLSVFSAAEPAIELDVQAAPSATVLGGEPPSAATLAYAPQEPGAYALLQAIQTVDGIIYDITLPQVRPAQGGMVLGPDDAGTLHFPINPLLLDQGSAPAASQGAVLGFEDVVGGLIGGQIGGVILKRVVQVIKSPIEHALIDTIRKTEGDPWVGVLRDPAGAFEPLQGFDAWRSLLPPGGERRVLLFVHGFSSSLGGAGRNDWFGQLGQHYDAVLGYNHPTISIDPEANARELLAMIPDDLRLSVDLIAHSRGGLVSRSLVELVEPQANFSVRRLITNGTPHGGTRLAEPERWDRLISIGMTAASLLASATGALVWLPKALELVLKAASQIVFDLPGLGAMTPQGDFIKKLNASPIDGSAIAEAQQLARYSAATSRFSVFSLQQPAFQQAFKSFAAQAFFDTANDLVVPTESMTMLDSTGLVPKERQLLSAVDHFSYFGDPQVIAFIAKQLAE